VLVQGGIGRMRRDGLFQERHGLFDVAALHRSCGEEAQCLRMQRFQAEYLLEQGMGGGKVAAADMTLGAISERPHTLLRTLAPGLCAAARHATWCGWGGPPAARRRDSSRSSWRCCRRPVR